MALLFFVFTSAAIEKNQNAGSVSIIGIGSQCNFATIQAGIDSGAQELRIVNNIVFTETLMIVDQNINMRGGFNNCLDAFNNIQQENGLQGVTHTKIDHTGLSTSSMVSIFGATQRNEVALEYFHLTGASTSPIESIGADVILRLNNVNIDHNIMENGNTGGGILIIGGSTTAIIVDTMITENEASSGGGIYCDSFQSAIVISGEKSGISQNSATGTNLTGKGGAVYLTNGCNFTMTSGSKNINQSSTLGITGNSSKEHGGGVFANNGSDIFLIGQEFDGVGVVGTFPINVSYNTSDSDNNGDEEGGGIYISGADSRLLIFGGLINHNTSPNGGGVYVNDDALMVAIKFEGNCWSPIHCNLFQGNIATNSTGGAIYNNQAQIAIGNSYFEDNQAGTGTAIYSTGNTATNVIVNSVFNHNSDSNNSLFDQFVIRAFDGAIVEIYYSTFADNDVQSSVFGISLTSSLTILSSIVDEISGLVVNNNPGTIDANCLIANDLTNISGTNLVSTDPQFIDRNNRNYHLNPLLSPAIDFCEDIVINSNKLDIDIDDQIRGFDDPIIINRDNNPLATYDIGADESYGNEIIFIDGFE